MTDKLRPDRETEQREREGTSEIDSGAPFEPRAGSSHDVPGDADPMPDTADYDEPDKPPVRLSRQEAPGPDITES